MSSQFPYFTHIPTVTVTDSGSGGLTILKKIRDTLPGVNVIYMGDNRYAPYGVRSSKWVVARSKELFADSRELGASVHVIACNTSCAVAMQELACWNSRGPEVVGTIDAASLAAVEKTKSGVIGVLATSLTVDTASYTQTIRKIDSQCTVHELKCDEFVALAERGDWEGRSTHQYVQSHLSSWLSDHSDIDTIVSGCTHFPLLRRPISAVCGSSRVFLNPAAYVARRVRSALRLVGAMPESADQYKRDVGGLLLVASGNPEKLSQHAMQVLDLDESPDCIHISMLNGRQVENQQMIGQSIMSVV